MTASRTCDGVSRRDLLHAGAIGFGGLTLGQFLRISAANASTVAPRASSAIFVNLVGGPSHVDTFDMKPESGDEVRGDFRPIDTNVPGIQLCEHLPKLAQVQDKFAILRGVSHTLADHRLGSDYVNTGNRPLATLAFPGYGAVVARELGGPPDLPPFVGVPEARQGPGYLGIRYAPLQTSAVPVAGEAFSVRGISLRNGVTVQDIHRRQELLQRLDVAFDSLAEGSQLLDGLDRFSQQAVDIIASPRARDAFDVSLEAPSYAQKFGESRFGQSCLLAVRLIEAGVRFVTITLNGWDTHYDNWTQLKDTLLPSFDEGLAALYQGLEEKGLLKSTIVLTTGEFGRTPVINADHVGRDHYPRCMFMLMAGGGVRGGQVLGKSDETGSEPISRPYTPDDVASTFYHALGIDHLKEYETPTGRPVMIVRDGTVISDVFS